MVQEQDRLRREIQQYRYVKKKEGERFHKVFGFGFFYADPDTACPTKMSIFS
jgi:hypothetical protein